MSETIESSPESAGSLPATTTTTETTELASDLQATSSPSCDLMSISSGCSSTSPAPPQSSSSSSPAPTSTPSNPAAAANTAKLPKSSSSTKGMGCGRPGYITCSICSATKYYSHVQRRFGQFSCEPCSKFMKRFLRDPKKYTCFDSGNCLIGRPSGEQEPRGVSVSRCKACWLKICLEKFVLEPNTREAIQQHYQPLFVTSPASASSNNSPTAASSTIAGIQMMICSSVHAPSAPTSPSSDPHRRGSDAPDPSNCSSSGVSVSSHASSSSLSSESLPLPLPLPQRKRKLQSASPAVKSTVTGDRVTGTGVRRRTVVRRRAGGAAVIAASPSPVIPVTSTPRPAAARRKSPADHHVSRSSASSFTRKQQSSTSTSLSSAASPSSKLSSRIIRSDHFHHHHMDLDRDDDLDFLHEDDHRYSRCQKTFNQEFYEAADEEDEEEDDEEEEDQEEEDDEGYDDFFDPFAVRSLLPDSLFFDEILNTNSPFL